MQTKTKNGGFQQEIIAAKACEERGNFTEALKLYREAIKKQPEHTEARLGVGRCAIAIEAYTTAYEQFNHALIYARNNAQAYWGRGYSLICLEHLERGLSDVRQAVQLDSPPTTLRIDCAAIFNEFGYVEEAMNALEPLAQDSSVLEDEDFLIEWAYAELSVKGATDVDLERLLQDLSNDPLVMLMRAAQLQSQEGNSEKAREKRGRALAMEPELQERLNHLFK